MSENTQTKEKRTFKQEFSYLKDKRVRAYCINCISQYLLPLFGMYSCTTFMTTRLGYSAMLVASLALIANGIGTAMGFIVGPLLQSVNLNKKKDRIYNWLQASKWVYSVLILVMFFNLQLFGAVGPIVASICYFGINIINPIHNSTTFCILGVISGTDIDARDGMGVWGVRFNKIGSLIGNWIKAPLIALVAANFGNPWSHFPVAVIYALIFFVCNSHLANVYKKECLDKGLGSDSGSSQKRIGFFETFKYIFMDKRLLVMVIADIFYFIANGIISNGSTYWWQIHGMYDTSFALSATVVSISTWVLTIIMPSIGFKLGKKNAKRLGYWLYALGPVILLIFGRYSCWVHTGTQVLAQVAYLVFAGFMAPIMIAEADRFYHKTGKDLRAVAPSLLTLPSTIGMAVGAAIMNYGVAAIGIDSIDWTDIASIVATMPNGFKNNYLFVWAGLTVSTAAIGAIIWIFAYRMTDAESKQYALENIEHDKKVRTASEVGTKS